ncbi:MAG: glycosyltransferase family 9 protein [Candidatus Eisenbacteria bacterium]|nr:glycosyltransferase family 9 protein [Candidatus Eisenbacteria bacterium]
MNLLALYLRYQKDWLSRRSPASPVAVRQALSSPKRIAVCMRGDPRLPPLAVPALRLLRDRFPEARLLLASSSSNTTVFRREKLADRALVFRASKGAGLVREIRRIGREIAELKPDFLLVLDPGPDPALLALAHASAVPLRIGFGCGDHFPFLNFEAVPPKGEPYLARAFLSLVGAITGRFVDYLDDSVRWRVPEPDARRADRLIHFWQPRAEELLVAIEPAGIEGREPDLDKFAAVARLLARSYRARILIVTEPENRAAGEELERRLAFLEPYRAPVDEQAQVIAFLSRADLAVCTNTPLFHYAVALGVPALGLFAEHEEAWYRPPAEAAAALLPLQKEITEERFLAAVDGLGALVAGPEG